MFKESIKRKINHLWRQNNRTIRAHRDGRVGLSQYKCYLALTTVVHRQLPPDVSGHYKLATVGFGTAQSWTALAVCTLLFCAMHCDHLRSVETLVNQDELVENNLQYFCIWQSNQPYRVPIAFQFHFISFRHRFYDWPLWLAKQVQAKQNKSGQIWVAAHWLASICARVGFFLLLSQSSESLHKCLIVYWVGCKHGLVCHPCLQRHNCAKMKLNDCTPCRYDSWIVCLCFA